MTWPFCSHQHILCSINWKPFFFLLPLGIFSDISCIYRSVSAINNSVFCVAHVAKVIWEIINPVWSTNPYIIISLNRLSKSIENIHFYFVVHTSLPNIWKKIEKESRPSKNEKIAETCCHLDLVSSTREKWFDNSLIEMWQSLATLLIPNVLNSALFYS